MVATTRIAVDHASFSHIHHGQPCASGLTHGSSGARQSTTQTAPRSVQPFLQGSSECPAHREKTHTDHAGTLCQDMRNTSHLSL